MTVLLVKDDMVTNVFNSAMYSNECTKYNVKHLYSVPVYVAYSDPNGPVQSEVENIISDVNFGTVPENWGRTHQISKSDHIDSYFIEDVIKQYKLVEFEKMLHEALDHYYFYFAQKARPLKYRRVSWFTKTQKNDYAAIHSHLSADISGCYYVATTGEDGDFFFTSPTQTLENSPHFSHLANRFDEKPEVGKLMLFPGFMSHGIKTNMTDSTRISISFNIHFEDNGPGVRIDGTRND
jgi:uncharacterized protein (TIGR02466 family)